MTSMVSQSAPTILCTAKQTRFHTDSGNFRELDIAGLQIVATSGRDNRSSAASSKSKARSEGVEILTNARLLLKQGQRYALVGRNGTGKSTLLKAIAEKIIPGIPEGARIAILQQSILIEDDGQAKAAMACEQERNVLQEVIDRATARDTVEEEIKVLSDGVDALDPFSPVRALRLLKHDRLQKRLFHLHKEATLKSGARGMQARKTLAAFEKVVAESSTMLVAILLARRIT
ncbi:hypothetical protein UVI_02033060 [Ustilaginoidea virens]|uniref:ABC transporter domain-containing protein n=1 Tax=Ustilaginoidea virens TaxID=1159556 RepID=A0A1B5L720_USTVR|nr:hypothetical protein UVI_02033060 [Ustilaginoidea virens]